VHTLKKKVAETIKKEFQERLQLAVDTLNSAIESRNNDTKSSAGDKYETSREMIQQEINSIEEQIFQLKAMLNELQRLPLDENPTQATSGSLVETDVGLYLLGLSAGKISIGKQVVYAISLASPLGKLLLNQKKGASIKFNNSTQTILNVY